MAIAQPSLLPGLEDEVLLRGLEEMRILQTKTTWIITHGPGMEFPLEPSLPRHQFTSNGADKRARTDYLSMYDYMARVYTPKPDDLHPKPHAKVGASEFRSMFDYMIRKHRADLKRRSRRVYEKPSVIYRRGLPVENAATARKEVTILLPDGEAPGEGSKGEVTLRKSARIPVEESASMTRHASSSSTGAAAGSSGDGGAIPAVGDATLAKTESSTLRKSARSAVGESASMPRQSSSTGAAAGSSGESGAIPAIGDLNYATLPKAESSTLKKSETIAVGESTSMAKHESSSSTGAAAVSSGDAAAIHAVGNLTSTTLAKTESSTPRESARIAAGGSTSMARHEPGAAAGKSADGGAIPAFGDLNSTTLAKTESSTPRKSARIADGQSKSIPRPESSASTGAAAGSSGDGAPIPTIKNPMSAKADSSTLTKTVKIADGESASVARQSSSTGAAGSNRDVGDLSNSMLTNNESSTTAAAGSSGDGAPIPAVKSAMLAKAKSSTLRKSVRIADGESASVARPPSSTGAAAGSSGDIGDLSNVTLTKNESSSAAGNTAEVNNAMSTKSESSTTAEARETWTMRC